MNPACTAGMAGTSLSPQLNMSRLQIHSPTSDDLRLHDESFGHKTASLTCDLTLIISRLRLVPWKT